MLKKYLLIIFILTLSLLSRAQNDFTSQDELKKKAQEYFKSEDYVSAMPLYSQLVSLYSKDPLYNYRFGVCALFADRRDLEKPLKYLLFAASKPDVDNSVYYYLGLTYHQNYMFAEAIKQFEIYKLKAAKSSEKLDVDRQIEICENAKSMLSRIKDIYVLQKTEVAQKDVFRSYDVDRFGGKILVKPDIFKTALDKKKEKFSLVFFTNGNKEAYFSSYGKDGKNGKDIFKSLKKDDGSWSNPVNLGNSVNTKYDEDFPFLLSDGVTLYFSSKGRNTLGGYDIFTSTINDNGVWSLPENLNYPINSPLDDILFVPDSSESYAYFSSNRSSIENLITVYKVRIDKRIDVAEAIVLEVNEIKGQTETQYNQTIAYLKEKGNLDINATEKMFADNTTQTNNIITENDTEDVSENDFVIPENITNQDIVKMAEVQAKKAVDELKDLKKQKEAAKTISQKRKSQSESKYTEAQSIQESAKQLLDQNQKQTEIAKANKLKSEAEQLNKESEIALQISDQLDTKITVKQKDADDAVAYSKEIKKAIQANNSDSSIAILNRMIDNMQKIPANNEVVSVVNTSKEFAKQKNNEVIKIKEEISDIQSEADALKIDAETFRSNAQQTKKKSVKEELIKKAEESEAEAKTKQSEADVLLQKSEKIFAQIDSANAESEIFSDVTADIKTAKNSANISGSSENNLTQNKTQENNSTSNNTTSNNITTNETTTNNTTLNNTSTTDIKTNNLANNNSTSNNTTENNTTENNVTANNIIANNTVANTSKSVTSEDKKLQQQLAAQTEIISKNISEESKEIRTQSDASYNLANVLYKQSVSQQKQADNLIAESKEVADDDAKQDYLVKAEKLKAESLIAAQKAYTAFDIAKTLDEVASNRENTLDMASEVKIQITEALNNNQTSKADSLVKELKVVYSEKITSSEKTSQYYSDAMNALDAKEYESENASEAYKQFKTEVDANVAEAKKLRQDANNSSKPSDRKDLMKQAETKESIAVVKQKQVDSVQVVSDALKKEVAFLKIKVNYSTTLAEETKKYFSEKTPDKVAIEASIKIIEKETLFAQNNTSNEDQENQIEENNDNIVENKTVIENQETAIVTNNSNINSEKQNNQNVNNQIEENKSSEQKDNNLKNQNAIIQKSDNAVENYYSEKEIAQVKSIYIDKSISVVSNEIQRLKSEIALKKDPTEVENLNKTLTDLQGKYISLKADSEKVSKLSGPKVVLNSKLKISAFELSEIIEKEMDSLKNSAQMLKIEASKETNPAAKKEILTTATEIENVVSEKEMEIFAVKSLDNTFNYITNSEKINSVKQVENTVTTAELLENEAKYYYDKAQSLKVSAEKNPSEIQKKTLLQESLNNEKTAIEKQVKAIEFYKAAANQTVASNKINTSENSINSNVSNESSSSVNANKTNNNTTELNNLNTTNENNNSSVSNSSSENTQNNNDGNQESVSKSNNSTIITNNNNENISDSFTGITINTTSVIQVNSDVAGLVPLDPVLPEGIIFKVQIAAVRNHVKPDVFKGITPLTGETTGAGLIRYLAGLFVKYEDANTAKTTIRTMGYTDAFVVAYYKGKRITVAEALALLKTDNSLQNTYADVNKSEFVSSSAKNTTTTVNSTNVDNTSNTIENNTKFSALSNPVSALNGLVYTVQVGVYARPVTSSQLFGISPLYDEIMTNGMYRYTFGKYSDLNSAVASKNIIVTKGITDAFVVAYYNGKKITMAEAKEILAANPDLANTSSQSTEVISNGNINKTESISATSQMEISFKVQIGAYKNDIPVDVVNGLLDVVVGNGMAHKKNAEGLTIYTSGNYTDYEKANIYKNDLIAKGLKDAFVVAFQGDEKISLTKAIELQKK